jgi:hypothetical protein
MIVFLKRLEYDSIVLAKLEYAPLPLLVLRDGSVPSNPHNFDVLETKANLRSNLGLGSAVK